MKQGYREEDPKLLREQLEAEKAKNVKLRKHMRRHIYRWLGFFVLAMIAAELALGMYSRGCFACDPAPPIPVRQIQLDELYAGTATRSGTEVTRYEELCLDHEARLRVIVTFDRTLRFVDVYHRGVVGRLETIALHEGQDTVIVPEGCTRFVIRSGGTGCEVPVAYRLMVRELRMEEAL